jgi:excisionase family DNA binding protein
MAESEWLTVAEIAEHLKVSDQVVRRWIRQGRIEAQNFGGRAGYRVRSSDLEKFLSKGKAAA